MSINDKSGPLGWYKRLLWGAMDVLGIDESIERKMVTAVLLQFLTALSVFVFGVALVGVERIMSMFSTIEIAAFVGMFALAFIAMVNTLLIVKADFVEPVKTIQTAADRVSQGEIDAEIEVVEQDDEIGNLSESFCQMYDYLRATAAQAEAIGNEDFDAEILERDLPGSFGRSLSQMEENLKASIANLNEQREEMRERNEALEQQAEAYQRTIAHVAEGDLTQRLDTGSDNEAMADIARSFNTMLDDWEEMIGSLIAFAEQVADESRDVKTSASEVQNASEDISSSIQEISVGVDREARKLAETNDEAENLSATIQEITASSDNVAGLTDETADVGSKGQESAEEAIDEMHAIQQRTKASVDAVTELNDTLAEIGNITDVILDIADQTNILALNAGIEAARASEGGEGFAVVADEVKNLAEETKNSAEDIESLIDEVQEKSDETVDEMETMTERVESGVGTVEEATAAFERMAENVSSINTSIKEISAATAEQSESTQDVVAMVEDVSAISDQTSAEAQTVAAAAQEQAATLNDVAQNTDRLAENANQLEGMLEEFAIEEAKKTADFDGVETEGGDGPSPSVDASEMEWQSVATDGGDSD